MNTRRFSFQATGTNFRPSQWDGKYLKSFDPGQIATFGGHASSRAPHGAVLIEVIPDLLPRESHIVGMCRMLQPIAQSLKKAGADAFILHVQRRFSHECNEEFSSMELLEIAKLDCHLFYTARQA